MESVSQTTAYRTVVGLCRAALFIASSASALFWGFVAAMTCDESCGDGNGWRQDPDAWQWPALGWMGAAGFLLTAGYLASALYASRSPTQARIVARRVMLVLSLVAIWLPWWFYNHTS
jgi:hypothetical protein